MDTVQYIAVVSFFSSYDIHKHNEDKDSLHWHIISKIAPAYRLPCEIHISIISILLLIIKICFYKITL